MTKFVNRKVELEQLNRFIEQPGTQAVTQNLKKEEDILQ
jgi:hypothetical protein